MDTKNVKVWETRSCDKWFIISSALPCLMFMRSYSINSRSYKGKLCIYILLGTLWQQYGYVTNMTFLKNVIVPIICLKNVINSYIFHYAWQIGYRFCQNSQKFILKRHGKKIVLLCQIWFFFFLMSSLYMPIPYHEC